MVDRAFITPIDLGRIQKINPVISTDIMSQWRLFRRNRRDIAADFYGLRLRCGVTNVIDRTFIGLPYLRVIQKIDFRIARRVTFGRVILPIPYGLRLRDGLSRNVNRPPVGRIELCLVETIDSGVPCLGIARPGSKWCM